MRIFLRLDSGADGSDWNYTVVTFVGGKRRFLYGNLSNGDDGK